MHGRTILGFAVMMFLQPMALHAQVVPTSYTDLVEWRSVGPTRGGRVVAVAGDPIDDFTFYQGTAGGGVWKTADGGIHWNNVSDGYFQTGSVGAIAIAESSPGVVYVGMGEACIRGNASIGDGVYKTADGGATWEHMGLEATSQTRSSLLAMSSFVAATVSSVLNPTRHPVRETHTVRFPATVTPEALF